MVCNLADLPSEEEKMMPLGFETDSVWRARGRGFQMGVVQPDGVTVHLTGQVAWDENERIVGLGDIDLQTRKCFQNIKTLLSKVGGHLSDIVAITTYFTDRSQLPAIQKVRSEFLGVRSAPVSTSVMVAGLGHEDFLVELTSVAVIASDRFHPPQ
jgi:enamine deaminase RidA (YjgF/YER057c/UK114 family)